jgi:hypothetical protein
VTKFCSFRRPLPGSASSWRVHRSSKRSWHPAGWFGSFPGACPRETLSSSCIRWARRLSEKSRCSSSGCSSRPNLLSEKAPSAFKPDGTWRVALRGRSGVDGSQAPEPRGRVAPAGFARGSPEAPSAGGRLPIPRFSLHPYRARACARHRLFSSGRPPRITPSVRIEHTLNFLRVVRLGQSEH